MLKLKKIEKTLAKTIKKKIKVFSTLKKALFLFCNRLVLFWLLESIRKFIIIFYRFLLVKSMEWSQKKWVLRMFRNCATSKDQNMPSEKLWKLQTNFADYIWQLTVTKWCLIFCDSFWEKYFSICIQFF